MTKPHDRGTVLKDGSCAVVLLLYKENEMASYSRDTIVRAARDCGMTPNSHILGRKDVHPNILRNYATSVLKDDSLVKKFTSYVKFLHRGGNPKDWLLTPQ